MNRRLVSFIIVSLAIGIVVGFAVGFTARIGTFFVDYGALQNEYMLLKDDYATLNDTYTALVSQYNSLQTGYSSLQAEYNQLEQNYATLNSEHIQLDENYTNLEQNYTWLKQYSFTYYTASGALNISSIEIEIEFIDYTTVRGNITNISSNPIDEVYVYALLRNPDGIMYFDYWKYEKIVDLYIGETASFDILFCSYVEGQTVEIWLVY